jgi:hypothetical protein
MYDYDFPNKYNKKPGLGNPKRNTIALSRTCMCYTVTPESEDLQSIKVIKNI